MNCSQPMTSRAALQALGHDLNSFAVLAELRLAHCTLCGRLWAPPHSEDAFDSFRLDWLGIVVPSGWTFVTNAGHFSSAIDSVQKLSPPEALLWCTEPCTGAPNDGHPGVMENAIYRLKALDLVDWRSGCLYDDAMIYRAATSWDVLPWAPMFAIRSMRAQSREPVLIPAAPEARYPR